MTNAPTPINQIDRFRLDVLPQHLQIIAVAELIHLRDWLQRLEGFARPRRPCNVEGNLPATRFNRDGEMQKAAADLFFLDDPRDLDQQSGFGDEAQPETIGDIRYFVSALEEAGQELVALSAQLLG